jgi:hypothetical protein
MNNVAKYVEDKLCNQMIKQKQTKRFVT